MKIKDIEKILLDYRCQHSFDDESEGMGLVDMLTPDNQLSIKLGKEEVEELAQFIFDEIDGKQ